MYSLLENALESWQNCFSECRLNYTTWPPPRWIDLTIDSELIVANPRRLRAVWTREAQEDLRSIHNLDFETKLTDALAQEINEEIDREVLRELI